MGIAVVDGDAERRRKGNKELKIKLILRIWKGGACTL